MDILMQSLRQEWQRLLDLAPKILLALIVFGAVLLVGRLLGRALSRALKRTPLPATQREFFGRAARWIFALIGMTIALNILELRGLAKSLAAGGGVTAIVLGFAFRGIGENLLAGLFLAMGRSFRLGDVIATGDFEGEVKSIELRHTHIRAADGRDIFIPSNEIFSKPLVNYTLDGLRRIAFTIGIDYRDDIERARSVLLQAVETSGLALTEPQPGVAIRSFAAAYVELQVFYWLNTFELPQGVTLLQTRMMERCRVAVLEAGFTVSSEVTTGVVLSGGGPLTVSVEDTGPRN